MINIPHDGCTGCTACVSICPQKCISMITDNEGFLVPIIDSSKCVECKLCEKTCPLVNKPIQECIPTKAFAAYSEDTANRLSSSSGGIFALLAKNVLENGGLVFGATFDEHFNVCHIGIESKEEIERLKGSKYVQSNLNSVFAEVKSALEDGRKVLFSGVICQIAGLKAFLKKDYPDLLTVDVLCHGVPSPKLWRKYIDEMEKAHGGTVRRMSFRNKQNGWKAYSVSFEFSNNTEYLRAFSIDPYMQMFLQNISLRNSCYNCRFNEVDRVSDITLGDSWGINKIMPDMDDNKGTSVVLVHTENGAAYFDKIRSQIVYRESDVDVILPPKSGGRQSVKMNVKRDSFFNLLDTCESFDELRKFTRLSFVKRVKRLIKKSYKRIKKRTIG